MNKLREDRRNLIKNSFNQSFKTLKSFRAILEKHRAGSYNESKSLNSVLILETLKHIHNLK